MKKLFSLISVMIVLISFSTVSCKKDLDKQLIGKWEMASCLYQYYNSDVYVSEETDVYEANETVIEILDNGTGKSYYFGDIEGEFTWSLDGSTLTVTPTGIKQISVMEFEVSVDGDVLTMVQTENITIKISEYNKVISTYKLNRK